MPVAFIESSQGCDQIQNSNESPSGEFLITDQAIFTFRDLCIKM
jgi:hypothetical protein